MSHPISKADLYFILKPSVIGGIEGISISLLAIGILATLSIPGVNAISSPLQILFIASGGSGALIGGFLFFARCALRHSNKNTVSQVAPLNKGVIERVRNFCYADSLIYALFIGSKQARIALLAASQKENTPEAELLKLLSSIVQEIEKGNLVSSQIMSDFQKTLVPLWKLTSNEIEDQEDAPFLFTFLNQIIEFDSFETASLKDMESICINYHLDEKQQLSLRELVQNIINGFEVSVKLPPFFGVTLVRDAQESVKNPILFEKTVNVNEIKSSYIHPDDLNSQLSLTGIVCYNGDGKNGHYWSYFVTDGKWKMFDDLNAKLIECSFDEVKSICSQYGRLLFFEKQTISN